MFFYCDKKMRSRNLSLQLVSCILLSIVIVLTACSDSKPIKIGFIGSLTGKRFDIGVSARNAVQLRIDELNSQGGINGRSIKLIVEDNRGDAKVCEKGLVRFIGDGVKSIIGPLFSQMADAASVLIDAMKSAKEITPKAVKEGLLKTKLFKGLDSDIVFDKYGDVAGNYSIIKVKNGSFVPVGFP